MTELLQGRGLVAEVIGLAADADTHRNALEHLYGSTTLATAEALLTNKQGFFAVAAPGMDFKGCDMHQRLLAAYGKLRHESDSR